MLTQKIDSPKVTEYTPLGLPNFSAKNALLRFNAGFLSARIGEWLFTIALNWVIFVQTESPLLLAVINACRLLPNLIFSVPAGMLADRYDRRALNVLNTVLNAVLTVGVGFVLYFGLPFWVCALFVTARAVLTAMECPIRNAYMCGIFSGDRLKVAVAQNASIMNLGRIIGPILGGGLISTAGSLSTFLLAGLLTLLFAVSLRTLPKEDLSPPAKTKTSQSSKASFRQILADYPDLRKLLLLSVPVMFFGFPFTGMLPIITESLLGLGSEEFGTLLAISAAGALVASWWLSRNPSGSNWTSTLNYSLIFGLSLVGLVWVDSFYGAAILLFAVGYFGQAYRSCSRMLFQEVVPKECAGKMLGVALMDRGIIPLGGLLIGAVAESVDLRLGVTLMGLGCILGVLPFYPLKTLGPWLYVRRSGVPEAGLLTGLVILGLSASLLLSGCQNSPPTTPPTSADGEARPSTQIAHVWGSTEVPLKPQRIVVLDIPFLDALTAMGQPVVGFAGTSEQNIPVYLQEKLVGLEAPLFVGERKQPNLEVILSLKPDLIVANPDRHKMIRQQLESIAPTIALDDDSLNDVRKMMATFSIVTQRREEHQRAETRLNAAITSAKEFQIGQPTVLVVGAFEDEFSTWTLGSFVGSLFTEVGADYLFKDAPSASESQTEVAKITIENLAQLNPDFLFVYGEPDRWKDHPIYQKLKAVQEDRVLEIDRDLWSRARGPVAAEMILDMYVDFLKSNQEVARSPLEQ